MSATPSRLICVSLAAAPGLTTLRDDFAGLVIAGRTGIKVLNARRGGFDAAYCHRQDDVTTVAGEELLDVIIRRAVNAQVGIRP
jgi:hypothetical protein